jgi:hypothetical protein
MKVHQNVDGSVLFSSREYDIASATAITPGEVVCLTEGLVTAAAAGQSAAILGIAAEAHTGVPDALNIRANGTRIRVYDNPGLLMRCAAPQAAATGGTATTVTMTALAAFSADDFNGGFLMLVSKADGSTNTDPIGTVKRITDYAYNATGTVSTFTVASGAVAAAGDVYAIFPPIGFRKGNLTASRDGLTLTATAALALKVAGRIGGDVIMQAALHALAVS